MRTLQTVICIFACIFFITSCQREFEDPNLATIPPASSTDTFEVDIDGVSFPTYGISVAKTSNNINLVAQDVQALKKVTLTVPSDITAGSYPLDYSAMTYFGMYYPDASTTLVSGNGNLVIIENNVASKGSGVFLISAPSSLTLAILLHN